MGKRLLPVESPERPTVDEMSEWSFPASDPPATWTWDVPSPVPDVRPDDDPVRPAIEQP